MQRAGLSGAANTIYQTSIHDIRFVDGSNDFLIAKGEVPFCYFASGFIRGLHFPHLGFTDRGTGDYPTSYEDNDEDGLMFNNYDPFNNIFESAKTIKQNFKLDVTDILAIDPIFPIHLPQFAEFFYLNSVDKYIGGKLTSVTLKRL